MSDKKPTPVDINFKKIWEQQGRKDKPNLLNPDRKKYIIPKSSSDEKIWTYKKLKKEYEDLKKLTSATAKLKNAKRIVKSNAKNVISNAVNKIGIKIGDSKNETEKLVKHYKEIYDTSLYISAMCNFFKDGGNNYCNKAVKSIAHGNEKIFDEYKKEFDESNLAIEQNYDENECKKQQEELLKFISSISNYDFPQKTGEPYTYKNTWVQALNPLYDKYKTFYENFEKKKNLILTTQRPNVDDERAQDRRAVLNSEKELSNIRKFVNNSDGIYYKLSEMFEAAIENATFSRVKDNLKKGKIQLDKDWKKLTGIRVRTKESSIDYADAVNHLKYYDERNYTIINNLSRANAEIKNDFLKLYLILGSSEYNLDKKSDVAKCIENICGLIIEAEHHMSNDPKEPKETIKAKKLIKDAVKQSQELDKALKEAEKYAKEFQALFDKANKSMGKIVAKDLTKAAKIFGKIVLTIFLIDAFTGSGNPMTLFYVNWLWAGKNIEKEVKRQT